MPRASVFVVVFALVVVVALTVEALAAPPTEETARPSDSRPPPQVLIEARVLELRQGDHAGVGFDGTNFWLTQLGDAQNEPVFYSIDSHGQEQTSFPQEQVYVPEGHLDITFWDNLLWCSQ